VAQSEIFGRQRRKKHNRHPQQQTIIMMLSNIIFRTAASRHVVCAKQAARFLGTSKTVSDALAYSGYSEIDFTIAETATVYEAVQKLAAFNIGCLVTVDAAGT
jgi:hypothetical protein